jgi:hypothetical protein
MDATLVPKPVAEFAAMSGTDAATYTRERPGMSALVLEDGVVYQTYSAYARGLDVLWGMHQWLDRAPKGRSERASGGAATTNTSPFLRTPTHVATRQRRTREHSPLHTPSHTELLREKKTPNVPGLSAKSRQFEFETVPLVGIEPTTY